MATLMLAVRCSERASSALTERLALLEQVRGLLPPTDLLYLLDIDRTTAVEALNARLRRQPYVVDIGDDAGTLARGAGLSASRVRGRQWVARAVLHGSRAIVHRGYFHQLALPPDRTSRPLFWAPDTVDDACLDMPSPVERDSALVATFGSITSDVPRASWPEFYGAELLDILDEAPGVRGLVVLRGPGADAFRRRAEERGLSARIEWHHDLPLEKLFALLRRASFVTSFQTDDLTGWSRTTGKLPLALGAGCGLLTTAVGEASRVLPADQMSSANRADFLSMCHRRIARGWSADDAARSRLAAERYRRSNVAASLVEFLEALQ